LSRKTVISPTKFGTSSASVIFKVNGGFVIGSIFPGSRRSQLYNLQCSNMYLHVFKQASCLFEIARDMPVSSRQRTLQLLLTNGYLT
jgi:hypothetical protein